MQAYVAKYNRQVPRYTSYPTAPHFSKDITATDYTQWLGALAPDDPISLYIHIPFCAKLCYYCGCNMRVVNSYDPVFSYVDAVCAEISHVAAQLPRKMKVSHIHWGGGTPTMLAGDDFKRISAHIYDLFNVEADAEIAVEIDPRQVDQEKVNALKASGINRASMGVQDFDPGVQKAINRVQSYELTRDLCLMLRDAGIDGINFDLIYGLPLQTLDIIDDTVSKTLALKPSRVALFGYAHVPWMKKHQKILEQYPMPNGDERVAMFAHARKRFEENGYTLIGLDHFALPEDTMAKAYNEGTLHRNFQGYTVDRAQTLIGFGASAIGSLPQGYVQNTASSKDYLSDVKEGGLATANGVKVSADDVVRRHIIERIMCDYAVDLAALTCGTLLEKETFKPELASLAEMVQDGLVELDGRHIRITEAGRPFVRLVAAAFDVYLKPQTQGHATAV